MIVIKDSTTNRILRSFDRLRPDIITSGDKHIITYKGTKFLIPLSMQQRINKGNTR